MKKKLKTLAISLATGLIFGAGLKWGRRTAPDGKTSGAAEETDLSPVLDRLEAVEARIGNAEGTVFSEGRAAELLRQSLQPLEEKIGQQAQGLESLHTELALVERRTSDRISALSGKIDSMEAAIPEQIESALRPRLEELEQWLRRSFEETDSRAAEAFAQTIETRVLGRLTALEQSLAEQSRQIAGMRDRSGRTDADLQKMLSTIDRLGRANGQAAGAHA